VPETPKGFSHSESAGDAQKIKQAWIFHGYNFGYNSKVLWGTQSNQLKCFPIVNLGEKFTPILF
jgi:hypothetical protein